MSDKKTGIAYLYLIITFCAWGSLYVANKFVLGKIPVFTVTLLRFIVGGTVLFFILKNRKIKRIQSQDYKYIFSIGFLGYFLSMIAQSLGTKWTNASFASLINSMNPITITLFAAILANEKLTLRKVIYLILALIGVYIIIGDINGNRQVLGILASVTSIILWSYVSVIMRIINQKYDYFQITVYGMFVGSVCTLPFGIYEFIKTPNIKFNWVVILSLIYMGLICTALAHVLWNKSLSMLEAGTCSLFYPLQPMVAALLGWLLLGESISINFIFGAILIVGVVVLSIIDKNNIVNLKSK